MRFLSISISPSQISGNALWLLVFPLATPLVLEDFVDDQSGFGQRERVRVVVGAEFERRGGLEIALGEDALAMGWGRELDIHGGALVGLLLNEVG